jgi:L-lactate permease
MEFQMKGIIAWFLGVPLIAIIALYYFDFFWAKANGRWADVPPHPRP